MSNQKNLDQIILGDGPIPNDIAGKEFLAWLDYKGISYRYAKSSHIIINTKLSDGTLWHYVVPVGHPKTINPVYIKKRRQKLKGE